MNLTSTILRTAAVALTALTAAAALAGVPQIKSYYPVSSSEYGVQDLMPKAKAYVYFETGAKVKGAKATVEQGGAKLGTFVYTPTSSTSVSNVVMAEQTGINAFMQSLEAGEFTLTFYEVQYEENGETLTYSDTSNPLGTAVYNRPPSAAVVTAESGFDDRTMLSYYPADGTAGVKTFTFSKPLNPEGIKGELEYGYGENRYYTKVPLALSADGKTLSVDLRGHCYNVEALAPGVRFVDSSGNPIDPPNAIVLNIRGLVSADGSTVAYVARELDGDRELEIYGRISLAWHYLDITLPTPVIADAWFYNSNDTQTVYKAFSADTDMLAMRVDDDQALVSGTVTIALDGVTCRIEPADYSREAGLWTMKVPADLLALGSGSPVLCMEDLVFDAEDGAQHTVRPYDMAKNGTEVYTVAEMKALADGASVTLNSAEGLLVTLSNDFGYTFMEDSTGGVMVVTEDFSRVLDEGTLLKGYIVGKWVGNGMFAIDIENSEIDATTASVSEGAPIATLAELFTERYENCLVTLTASEDLPIAVEDGKIDIEEGLLTAVTDFVDNLSLPETVETLTGVYFADRALGTRYLMLRSNADINEGRRGAIEAAIADARAPGNDVFTLTGVRLDASKPLAPGLYIGADGSKRIVK